MTTTVRSLQDISINYLADNFEQLWTFSEDNQNQIVWRDPGLGLLVPEELLYELSKRSKLNDGTLSLFQPEHACLKHVTIPDARHITKEGLKTLASHRLLSLDICNSSLTLVDVLKCLEPQNLMSLKDLRCKDLKQMTPCLEPLSVSDNSNRFFPRLVSVCRMILSLNRFSPRPDNVCRLSLNSIRFFPRLDNVCRLSLINVGLTDRCLDVIASNVPNLQSLDISKNFITNISPLQKYAEQLQELIMYRLCHLTEVTTFDTLSKLKHLQHLDVSVGSDWDFPDIFQKSSMLMDPSTNPNLTSLDLSGREGATEEVLGTFLDAHPSLSFLGLMKNRACWYPMFDVKSPQYRPGIKVAGTRNLEQMALSLRRYHKSRPLYTDDIFYMLYITELSTMTTDNDDIIRALSEVMSVEMPFDSIISNGALHCLWCLNKLLRYRCVSHIHPDTIKQLLRACHQVQRLAQSSQQSRKIKTCLEQAQQIMQICENLKAD